jgi:subtilisin-like proprotein convertase family protein
VQRIGAILVIVAGACGGAVYAGHMHIYSGDFNLRIPAELSTTKGWMDDAIIEIPNHFIITDLDVGITLTHTNVLDLQIFLRSPAKTIICLNMYNLDPPLNKGANYTQTVFDDEAPLAIEDAQPPFTGRFRPLEPYRLSAFDGEDSFGPWRLRIYDFWTGNTGTLNSVELMITAPEPATAILLTIGVGLTHLFKHPNPKLQK